MSIICSWHLLYAWHIVTELEFIFTTVALRAPNRTSTKIFHKNRWHTWQANLARLSPCVTGPVSVSIMNNNKSRGNNFSLMSVSILGRNSLPLLEHQEHHFVIKDSKQNFVETSGGQSSTEQFLLKVRDAGLLGPVLKGTKIIWLSICRTIFFYNISRK